MRLQTWITVVTGVLTVVYVGPRARHIDLGDRRRHPRRQHAAGHRRARVHDDRLRTRLGQRGGRLLPLPAARGRPAPGWSAGPPSAARSPRSCWWSSGCCWPGPRPDLNDAIAADPIGALALLLPTWFLVPFVVVAVLGLVGGAVLDIYSSGLALLSAGLKVPRPVAAGIDGVLMILGAIYVVFFAGDFLGPFQGFLITLGVPIAAWCGVFLADLALRRTGYDGGDLFDPRGRYGSVRIVPVALVVLGSVIGWGLVTNTFAGWLSLAGLPARAVRPRWPRRRVGVRQPRRARRPSCSASSGRCCSAVVRCARRRRCRRPRRSRRVSGSPWLVADRPAARLRRAEQPVGHAASSRTRVAGTLRLLPSVRRTRGAAPASSRRTGRPARGCRTTRSGRSRWTRRTIPLYDLVHDLPVADAVVLDAPDVRQVGRGDWPPRSPGVTEIVLTGVSTDCCVLSTALAAADAGVHVRVVADACAGRQRGRPPPRTRRDGALRAADRAHDGRRGARSTLSSPTRGVFSRGRRSGCLVSCSQPCRRSPPGGSSTRSTGSRWSTSIRGGCAGTRPPSRTVGRTPSRTRSLSTRAGSPGRSASRRTRWTVRAARSCAPTGRAAGPSTGCRRRTWTGSSTSTSRRRPARTRCRFTG